MGEKLTAVRGLEPEAVDLPIWKEHRALLEWLELRSSELYSGEAVPAGDRSPVLLIPGFLCGDLHLFELHRWLERIGYRPYSSGILLNARCLDASCQGVIARIKEIHAETGRRVHLVGHSLGGMLARSAAALSPARVASVVAMGSPFQQLRANTLVLSASRVIGSVYRALPSCDSRCMTPACGCPTVQEAGCFPRHIPFTAIYTREDAVVDWESCRTGDVERDVEVSGTHLGLMYNRDAYRAIAHHLMNAREDRRVRRARFAHPERRAA
jgi:triacylglycerol lipase